ncbi:MAG: amidohydrolase [Candidatus Anstonellaceae archaeon]
MDILLENGLVLSPSKPYKFKRANLLISEGKIKKISQYKISCNNVEKFDCTKKAILPGFVNTHTHSPMSILRGLGEDKDLFEWLNNYIWPVEKKLSEEDVYWGSLLSILEMLKNGISCFNDHYFHIRAIAQAALKAKIRCVLGYSMIDLGDFDGKGQKELDQAKKDLKLILEYKNNLLKPSINPHAPNTCSKQLLEECAKLAREYGCILHTHLAETKSEVAFVKKKYGCTPTTLLKKTNCLSSKTILAHCVYCTPKDIEQIAKSSAAIAHCPVANFKLGSGSFAPLKEFLKNNILVGFGTDGPASNNSLNLLETAKFALLIQKNFYGPSIINSDQALEALTIGGYRALDIAGGSILEGQVADLVLFDLNSAAIAPFSNNSSWIIYSNSSGAISDVIIDGMFVMKNKKILTFSEEEVLIKATQVRKRLLKETLDIDI